MMTTQQEIDTSAAESVHNTAVQYFPIKTVDRPDRRVAK